MMDPESFLLEARHLHVTRSSGEDGKEVLKGASLALHPGEILRLRGPSGSGKSTFLWVLARMLPKEKGEILFKGRDSSSWLPSHWRAAVALVLQKHSVFGGTVRENLSLPWRLKVRRGAEPDDERMRAELDRVGLSDVELESDASRLSVGQTARLSLVRTLLTEPDLLLLDEPFAALDEETSLRVMERIRDFAGEDNGVIMAAHESTVIQDVRTFRLSEGVFEEEA